jgi:HEAT repeat protein
VNTARTRSQKKQAAVDLVREEEKRRGIQATSSSAPLDPISAYIVVLKTGAADPKAQRDAAWRLGNMGPGARDAVPALLDALKSPSEQVRTGAAEALGKIDGQNPTVVSGVKALFQDPSLDVWSTVVPEFARKGDPDAQKVLLAKLEDPYLWARERACGILGSLRETPAFAAPAILARLKTETDWRVRIGCARALGTLGQPSAEATALLESLANSPKSHPDLVKAAAESLTKLGAAKK